MKKVLMVLTAAVMVVVLQGAACNQTVVRDATVYRLELGFMEQAAVQSSAVIEDMLGVYCTCDSTKQWTTVLCAEAAKKALVVKTRVPFHKNKALFNAGLLETDPGTTAPAVPEVSTLCK